MKYSLFGRSFYTLQNAESGDGSSSGGGEATPPETPSTQPQAPVEDVTNLKLTMTKERDRANALEKQLRQTQDAFKGVDLDKYKQLEVLQQQQEELQQREQALRNQYEDEANKRVSAAVKKYDEIAQQFADLQKRIAAEKYYQAAEGRSGGDEESTFFESFYTNIQGNLRLNDKGELEVIDAKSGTRRPNKKGDGSMSALEYFTALGETEVYRHYFLNQARNGKGGGTSPGAMQLAPSGQKLVSRSAISAGQVRPEDIISRQVRAQ